MSTSAELNDNGKAARVDFNTESYPTGISLRGTGGGVIATASTGHEIRSGAPMTP